MATTVSLYGEQVALRPFSLREYHWLIDHGFFHGSERVELIQSVLHLMSPKGTRHAACQSRLLHQLIPAIGKSAWIRAQGPITIPESDSEPEADLVLAAPRESGYSDRHPYPADVLLVIEIAHTSLNYDRSVKVPLYAASGIAEYWIMNLQDDNIEVYREPITPQQGTSCFRQRLTLAAQDTVAPTHFPDCVLSVLDILPPKSN